jgi:single-stranded DNA-binding protein
MKAVIKCILLGAAYNLKKIETKSGKNMVTFQLRVWKGKKGEEKVMFLPIVAYAGNADVFEKYLYDGKLVYLDCEFDVYKDKESRERYQFIVQEFSFTGDKNGNT